MACLLLFGLVACGQFIDVSRGETAVSPTPSINPTVTIPTTEIDPQISPPAIALALHRSSNGYQLALQLENYVLQPSVLSGPPVQGQGTAHLHINGPEAYTIDNETVFIRDEELEEGVNHLVVGLNAQDGSLWTVGGQEIEAELTFAANENFPIRSNNLTYKFGWASPMTEPILQNDLGYEIALEEAYLLNATLELVPCSDTSWRSWLAPAVAYAGHGDSTLSESRVLVSQVETIGATADSVAGQASASYEHYCQLHYLVAPAAETAVNLPTTIDFSGQTLYFSGTYLASNATEPAPFVIQSDLAWGGLIDLPQPTEPNNEPIEIKLQRDWETLFDGVDFATMEVEEQAKAILRSLMEHSTIEID
ncbi:MAG: hypothetical protein AAF614_43405 [Chloroflexota bacterium]